MVVKQEESIHAVKKLFAEMSTIKLLLLAFIILVVAGKTVRWMFSHEMQIIYLLKSRFMCLYEISAWMYNFFKKATPNANKNENVTFSTQRADDLALRT